jgi:hypothetical protein
MGHGPEVVVPRARSQIGERSGGGVTIAQEVVQPGQGLIERGVGDDGWPLAAVSCRRRSGQRERERRGCQ